MKFDLCDVNFKERLTDFLIGSLLWVDLNEPGDCMEVPFELSSIFPPTNALLWSWRCTAVQQRHINMRGKSSHHIAGRTAPHLKGHRVRCRRLSCAPLVMSPPLSSQITECDRVPDVVHSCRMNLSVEASGPFDDLCQPELTELFTALFGDSDWLFPCSL